MIIQSDSQSTLMLSSSETMLLILTVSRQLVECVLTILVSLPTAAMPVRGWRLEESTTSLLELSTVEIRKAMTQRFLP